MVTYNLYAHTAFMKRFPGTPLYDRLQRKRVLVPPEGEFSQIAAR
jgi:hypothetical protein